MSENSSGPKGAMVDLDKLNQAISAKIRHCPLCGALNSFTVLPEIMEVRQFFHGNIMLGGTPVVPLVVLTCSECGNTVFINALKTNAIKKEADSQG